MVSLDLIRSACLEGQSNREAYNEVVLLRAWNMHSKFLCSPWTLKIVHFGLGQGQHLPFKSSQSCVVFCRYASPNKCTLPEFQFDMKSTKKRKRKTCSWAGIFVVQGIARNDRFLWATLMISYDYRGQLLSSTFFWSLKWWRNSRRVASDCQWIHQLGLLHKSLH